MTSLFANAAAWVRRHPARASALAGWYQQACGIGSSLLIIPSVLRLLGQENAGLWFSLQGFVMMFALVDFGFSTVISRQVAYSLKAVAGRTKEEDEETDLFQTRPGWEGISDLHAASRTLFLRVTAAAAALLVVAYFIVASFTKLLPGMSWESFAVWCALGGALCFSFQARTPQSFLDGLGVMYLGRIISGTQLLLTNLGGVLALCFWPHLLSMALATLGAAALQYFVLQRALEKIGDGRIDHGARADGEMMRRIGKVAVPFGVASSGWYLSGAAQVPLLGSVLGPAAVAPYYVALRISQSLIAAVMQITTAQVPFFTHECAAGAWEGAAARMKKTTVIGLALHLGAALFLLFVSPMVVDVWIGPGRYLAFVPLLIFCVNHFVSAAVALPAQFVLAEGRNPFATSTLAHGVLVVLGTLVFCPPLGISGVPVSNMVGGALTNFWLVPREGWRTWKNLCRKREIARGALAAS